MQTTDDKVDEMAKHVSASSRLSIIDYLSFHHWLLKYDGAIVSLKRAIAELVE